MLHVTSKCLSELTSSCLILKRPSKPPMVFKSECQTLKLIINNKSSIYLKQFGFKNFKLQQSQKKQGTVRNNKRIIRSTAFFCLFLTLSWLYSKHSCTKVLTSKFLKESFKEFNTLYTYCHTKSIKIGPKTSTKYKTQPTLTYLHENTTHKAK